jgi:hypothetical protein
VSIDNAALRGLTRWRNANARGVSPTAVYTSAVHLALREQGIPMAENGFYTLLDMRGLVRPDGQPVWGNLSKALYLTVDVADPRAVHEALEAARTTQRALPAALLGTLSSALALPRPPAAQAPVSPVRLTFNSMPTLPGLAELPWLTDTHRFFGFGPSLGPGDISVFAIRLRDHLELIDSFDEATAPATAVRAAVVAMAESPALPAATAA